jgi:phosphate ABC transporter permease protein PstC
MLLLIAAFVAREAAPALSADRGIIGFLFTDPWAPLADPPQFGIRHAWVSTLLVTGGALVIAVPTGFAIGAFLSEIAPRAVAVIVQPSIDVLAGIPSVVYGFVAYVLLLPWLADAFELTTGESVLAASLVLAAMVLPFIASGAAEAFRAVPRELKEAAYAQGVTRFHVIRRVIAPHAASGLFAAVALGLARAIGETLAVLMIAGNSIAVPESLLDRAQPITALIATELGEAGVGSAKYYALFGAGLVLLVIVAAINIAVWSAKGRLVAGR